MTEGNSKYAKELFSEDVSLSGFLNGKMERGSIEQFYHNVDTVGAGNNFKTRIDVSELEEALIFLQMLQLRKPVRIDVHRVVEEHFTSPASVEDLAYLSWRSLSSFKRDFRAIYHDTPAHWIREHRLNKACEMLESTKMTVADICYSLGFENPTHFSRIFKDRFGVAPSIIQA